MTLEQINNRIESKEAWLRELENRRKDLDAKSDDLNEQIAKETNKYYKLLFDKRVARVKSIPVCEYSYKSTTCNGRTNTTYEQGPLSVQWDNGVMTHIWLNGDHIWSLFAGDTRFEESDESPEDESKTA